MKLHLLACVALCVPLCAQSKSVTSPPGYTTAGQVPEDRTWGYYLGQYANERFQAADGQFRNQVLQIREIAFRLDQRSYASNAVSGGVGRTWSNVTLELAACDYDKVSATFAANATSTPVRVFSASMTWAVQAGTPATDPAPWGGNGLRFPFSTPYVHAGTADLLFDYVFTGGTLANAGAWSGATSVRYYLDGFYNPDFALGSATEYPASPGQTSPVYCTDSGRPSATDAARNDIQGIFVYNDDHASRGGQVFLQWRSFHTAASAPVVKAWGVAGSATGIAIGAACNRLYLDTSMPHFLHTQTVASTGTSPFTNLAGTFSPVLGGLSLWFQCAWDDSQTKRFSLTTATERRVPLAIPPRGPRRQALYASDPAAAAGTAPMPNGSSWAANPMYLILYD